jgi:hypothetical protein
VEVFFLALKTVAKWKCSHSWDQATFEMAAKENREYQQSFGPEARERPNMKERASIAEQAQALLRGDRKWEATKTVWEDFGDAKEVETDVSLPKE